MALYDVINDMTNRQIMKTETGDNRIFGVVVGKVTNNYDSSMPGKVCVSIPTRGDGKQGDVLKWARVAFSFFGTSWGQYFLPEVGDEVLLVFENGNIEKPYVIASIPRTDGSEKSKLLSEDIWNENNSNKTITTKHGNHLTFVDAAGDGAEQGEKDVILLGTPGKEGHILELDNEKHQITLGCADKKNMIRMTTNTAEKEGYIKVSCSQKFEVEVKGEKTVRMVMDGDTGMIRLTGSSFKVETQENAEVKAGASAKISGVNTSLSGSSSVKVSSDQSTSISGATVSIR